MQKIIWVVGPPRSGTTWVGRELAKRLGYHYAHEPFHPGNQPSWSPVKQQYHTEIFTNDELMHYLKSRINNRGEYLKWRLNRGSLRDRLYYVKKFVESLRSNGIVVKDPHLSLLSHQLIQIFPISIIVWVHRKKADHLDSLEKKGWKYNIKEVLQNEIEFISDERKIEFMELIKGAKSDRVLNSIGYDIFQAYRSFYLTASHGRTIVTEYDNIVDDKEKQFDLLIKEIKDLIDSQR